MTLKQIKIVRGYLDKKYKEVNSWDKKKAKHHEMKNTITWLFDEAIDELKNK